MRRKTISGLAAKSREELLVIDASIYLHRAWHASGGAPWCLVRGFAELLAGLLDTRPPMFAACAFDSGLPSYRVDQLESYKAHRPPHPDGFDEQLPFVHRLTRAMGIKVLVADRVEGDDLIAGAVRLARRNRVPSTIMSVDKDLAQLVQDERNSHSRALSEAFPTSDQIVEPRVSILTGPNGGERDTAAIYTKYGVWPHQIADWIGLAGDAADGLPGVEGIGSDLAARLLLLHKTIEGIVEADGVAAHTSFTAPPTAFTGVKRNFVRRGGDVGFGLDKAPTLILIAVNPGPFFLWARSDERLAPTLKRQSIAAAHKHPVGQVGTVTATRLY